MRRVVANGLLLAAMPVGVGVGLWMALLTYLPYCPVKGLGTAYLCAARSTFAPSLCVLCGAAAAALALLVSIAVRRDSPGLA
jgi:ABC-type microcin C transport system permease subunit YejB